jgi:hypothetical protein
MKKREWERNVSGMDWLESMEEDTQKRGERKRLAVHRQKEWRHQFFNMEWLTRMASLEEGMSTLIVECTAQELVDMEMSTQEEGCRMEECTGGGMDSENRCIIESLDGVMVNLTIRENYYVRDVIKSCVVRSGRAFDNGLSVEWTAKMVHKVSSMQHQSTPNITGCRDYEDYSGETNIVDRCVSLSVGTQTEDWQSGAKKAISDNSISKQTKISFWPPGPKLTSSIRKPKKKTIKPRNVSKPRLPSQPSIFEMFRMFTGSQKKRKLSSDVYPNSCSTKNQNQNEEKYLNINSDPNILPSSNNTLPSSERNNTDSYQLGDSFGRNLRIKLQL